MPLPSSTNLDATRHPTERGILQVEGGIIWTHHTDHTDLGIRRRRLRALISEDDVLPVRVVLSPLETARGAFPFSRVLSFRPSSHDGPRSTSIMHHNAFVCYSAVPSTNSALRSGMLVIVSHYTSLHATLTTLARVGSY